MLVKVRLYSVVFVCIRSGQIRLDNIRSGKACVLIGTEKKWEIDFDGKMLCWIEKESHAKVDRNICDVRLIL